MSGLPASGSFLNPASSPPTQWVDNQPPYPRVGDSSKGEHVRPPGSTKPHTHSAFMASRPPPAQPAAVESQEALADSAMVLWKGCTVMRSLPASSPFHPCHALFPSFFFPSSAVSAVPLPSVSSLSHCPFVILALQLPVRRNGNGLHTGKRHISPSLCCSTHPCLILSLHVYNMCMLHNTDSWCPKTVHGQTCVCAVSTQHAQLCTVSNCAQMSPVSTNCTHSVSENGTQYLQPFTVATNGAQCPQASQRLQTEHGAGAGLC